MADWTFNDASWYTRTVCKRVAPSVVIYRVLKHTGFLWKMFEVYCWMRIMGD